MSQTRKEGPKSNKERTRDPPLLTELQDFVNKELSNSAADTLHAELPVYRAAFEKFIDSFDRYAPILTSIKEHYEEAIRDHEKLVGKNSYMKQQVVQLRDEKDNAFGRLQRKYEDELKGLKAALKHQSTLARQYQQSVAILKEEIVKVYRDRDSEHRGRMAGERTLRILSKSVKSDRDELKELTSECKALRHENNVQAAELQSLSGKVDMETYTNAKHELRVALDALEKRTSHNQKLQARVDELETIQQKIDANVCTVRARLPTKPDLQKYQLSNRGGPVNWIMLRQQNLGIPGWMTQGAMRTQCRNHHRYIRPLGETSQAAFLRTSKRIRNMHLSLCDVGSVVKAVFERLQAEPNKLIVECFYDVMNERESTAEQAVHTSYSFLMALEKLCYEPEFELFRALITGELETTALDRWRGMLSTMRDCLPQEGLSGDAATKRLLGSIGTKFQKTDEMLLELSEALQEDRQAGRCDREDLLDATFRATTAPSTFVETLWDQFYAEAKGGAATV